MFKAEKMDQIREEIRAETRPTPLDLLKQDGWVYHPEGKEWSWIKYSNDSVVVGRQHDEVWKKDVEEAIEKWRNNQKLNQNS